MNISKYQFLLNFVIIDNYFSYEDFFLMAMPISDCFQIRYLLYCLVFKKASTTYSICDVDVKLKFYVIQ